MDMPTTDPKRWLVGEIAWKAAWYGQVARLYSGDERCVQCAKTLNMLAATIRALPKSHPLFKIVEQINRVEPEAHARWLSELCLEFAHIAWFPPENTGAAIRQLMEITYDSLWEHANRQS
jgi:hypothetical protein